MLSRLAVTADRVLVQKITAKTKTAAGVLLPESAVQMINEGRVLGVGEKTKYGVKEGDRVIVPEFGGLKMKFDDQEVLVYREEDILGVLRE
jgi:chaperonin GroES